MGNQLPILPILLWGRVSGPELLSCQKRYFLLIWTNPSEGAEGGYRYINGVLDKQTARSRAASHTDSPAD